MRIVNHARRKGVPLRLVGGLAIRAHCEDLGFCEREYADIDLVGLSRDSAAIIEALQELGYTENRSMTYATGGTRLLFEKPDSHDHVDIFLDRLNIEHDIDLRTRLFIEEDTISVSDLLLAKLTITRLNEKDYRDMVTILKDLGFGTTDDSGKINVSYIAAACSKSWGLYIDVLSALAKILTFMGSYSLDEKAEDLVRNRIESLVNAIRDHPKTLVWKLRSVVGKRLSWRRPVETEGKVRLASNNDYN